MLRVLGPALLLALVCLAPCPAQATVHVAFPPQGIGPAVLSCGNGDSVLVSPGTYGPEMGVEIHADITIIGMGGSSANEIRVCAAMCPGYLFQVQSGADVKIEGLTVTKWDAGGIGVSVMGGGIASIRECVFRDLGAGIFMSGGNLDVRECTFYGQQAGSQYGIWMRFGTGIIENNTFAVMRNPIRLEEGSFPSIRNNIVAQNSGQGITCLTGSAPTFQCNDVWNNAQGNYVGCPDPTGTNGNFSADPLFCDPTSGNFGLLPGSPCLPENSPAGCGLIGANGPCEVLAVGEPTGVPSVSRLDVSPNPASGEVVFSIPGVTTPRTLEIFDANGRQVDVLRPMAGQITWHPSRDLTRGVYFARVTSPSPAVVKFVLLR